MLAATAVSFPWRTIDLDVPGAGKMTSGAADETAMAAKKATAKKQIERCFIMMTEDGGGEKRRTGG